MLQSITRPILYLQLFGQLLGGYLHNLSDNFRLGLGLLLIIPTGLHSPSRPVQLLTRITILPHLQFCIFCSIAMNRIDYQQIIREQVLHLDFIPHPLIVTQWLDIESNEVIQSITLLVRTDSRESEIPRLVDHSVYPPRNISVQLVRQVEVRPVILVFACHLSQVQINHSPVLINCLQVARHPRHRLGDVPTADLGRIVLGKGDDEHDLLSALIVLLLLLPESNSGSIRSAGTRDTPHYSTLRPHKRRGKTREGEARFGQSTHSEGTRVILIDEGRGREGRTERILLLLLGEQGQEREEECQQHSGRAACHHYRLSVINIIALPVNQIQRGEGQRMERGTLSYGRDRGRGFGGKEGGYRQEGFRRGFIAKMSGFSDALYVDAHFGQNDENSIHFRTMEYYPGQQPQSSLYSVIISNIFMVNLSNKIYRGHKFCVS